MNICGIFSIITVKWSIPLNNTKTNWINYAVFLAIDHWLSWRKKKNRKKLLCADYTADILLVYIFVQRDCDSVHPKHLCYKSMKTLGNFKKNHCFETLTNAQTKAQQTEKLWTEWDLNVSEDECTVYVKFANTSLGTRNKKKTTDN